MRKRFKLLIEENGDLFYQALVLGFDQIIKIVLKNPFLSSFEKITEVKRICSLVMRFDSAAFNDNDAGEAWIALGAVPAYHPARFVSDQVGR